MVRLSSAGMFSNVGTARSASCIVSMWVPLRPRCAQLMVQMLRRKQTSGKARARPRVGAIFSRSPSAVDFCNELLQVKSHACGMLPALFGASG